MTDKVQTLMNAAIDVVFTMVAIMGDLLYSSAGEMFVAPNGSTDDALELIRRNIKRVILCSCVTVDN